MGIPLLILVTCCSQLDFYPLHFSSTGSASNFSKIFHSFCGQKVSSAALKIRVLIDVNSCLSFCQRGQISLPYKRLGSAIALYTVERRLSERQPSETSNTRTHIFFVLRSNSEKSAITSRSKVLCHFY